MVNKLEKFGIPCAPVNKINESLKIKSLKERNHLLETKINKYIGSPIKLSGYKNTNKRKSAPKLDENRKEILKFIDKLK